MLNQNITASGQSAALNVANAGTAVFYLSGTFSLTFAIEASIDGTNWFAWGAHRPDNTTSAPVTTTGAITTARAYRVDTAGINFVRMRCSAYTSGTCVVVAEAFNSTCNASIVPAADASGQIVLGVGTSGGATIHRLASAASTNATSIKAAAGRVYGWSFSNTSAAAKYVKLYNKASAPTVGTDTPVIVVLVPATGTVSIDLKVGASFATGIAMAITGAAADTDTTAVAANDVFTQIFYG